MKFKISIFNQILNMGKKLILKIYKVSIHFYWTKTDIDTYFMFIKDFYLDKLIANVILVGIILIEYVF